jgi:hypothetical protein
MIQNTKCLTLSPLSTDGVAPPEPPSPCPGLDWLPWLVRDALSCSCPAACCCTCCCWTAMLLRDAMRSTELLPA